MYEESELVFLPKEVPARVVAIDTDYMPATRRDDGQLLFVVHGSPTLIIDGDGYAMEPEDVVYVNAGSLLLIEATSQVQVVSLRMSLHRLAGSLDDVRFRVNSSGMANRAQFRPLIHLLAQIIKANASNDESASYHTMALLYAVVDQMVQRFVETPGDDSMPSDKHGDRLRKLLRYIDENYAQGLTLNMVAEHEHLSAPYLSAFFKAHIGVTFSDYYNQLRLDRAVADLITSDESVEMVARRNGFRDPRAFVKLFKQTFDLLPSQYRRNERAQTAIRNQLLPATEAAPDTPLRILAKYLPADASQPSVATVAADVDPMLRVVTVDDVDTQAPGRHLTHNYRRITTVGRAKELLYEEVRDMLRQWQSDVNFSYIKFHGLFGDDMHVYREDPNGLPVYSWVLVDKVLDFLLSIGLRPFVQLSFMPQLLASDPTRTVYSAPLNVSPPRDLEAWQELVSAFMTHVIERYTAGEVSSWLFCVWNEPDTGSTLFGFDDDAEFYDFYQTTYQTVKSFGRDLSFGSPSMLVTYAQNKVWLLRFLDYADANDCPPDFFNAHFYDNDLSWDTLPQHSPGQPSSLRLNKDQDTFSKTIGQLKLLLADRGLCVPIYVTEWNLTVSHRDLLNDTTFKSCYLAKNLLENYDELDALAYWTLTDFIEELQPSADMFHGGLGLFTYNGVKKPHYHLFAALSRMGDRLLASGNGYFITAHGDDLQLIVYNYEHFSHLFASGERYDMTYLERYAPFSEVGRMDFYADLTGLAHQRYRVREHVINTEHGSAFDAWLQMGAPATDQQCVDYLRQVSVPQLIVNDVEADQDGRLTISAVLEPLEVRIIELTPVNRFRSPNTH